MSMCEGNCQLIADPILDRQFAVLSQIAKLGKPNSRGPFVPAFFVEMLKHMQQYDCSKGLRELGYPQSSVETAIRDALAWFKQNEYV